MKILRTWWFPQVLFVLVSVVLTIVYASEGNGGMAAFLGFVCGIQFMDACVKWDER